MIVGIGGFMGIEDIKPGMKIDLQLVGQEDRPISWGTDRAASGGTAGILSEEADR